jgi:DNA-binding MarR family transcriptional regulator
VQSNSALSISQSASSASTWAELSDLILRSSRSLRDELGRHTLRHGVSDTQFSLLWFSRQGPQEGVSQNEIASALALSPAHVSSLVEQLRGAGLLDGRRHPADRRRQVWKLTPQGQEQLGKLLAELVDWATELDRRLPCERREMLVHLLCDLIATPAAGEHRPALALFNPDQKPDVPRSEAA